MFSSIPVVCGSLVVLVNRNLGTEGTEGALVGLGEVSESSIDKGWMGMWLNQRADAGVQLGAG